MRKIRNKRANALRPINIINHKSPCDFYRPFELQITVIKAWKSFRP
jgi:hypothetical protein